MNDGIARRRFLASTAASAYAAGTVKKPNIVLILPDQMRGQDMGCAGNREVQTPNLDRLAGEGAHFPQTFANTPVCCPARAILMTGKYCHANGMTANDLRLRSSETTIAESLRNAGYRTGFVGKWHLDGGPRLPGFVPPGSRRGGFEFWAANECDHRPFDTAYFRDTSQPTPLGKFEAEGWTDLAIEFLRGTRDDKRPFFLSVFMGPPHDPYVAPPEYLRKYDPQEVTLRPNWKARPGVPGKKEIAAYYAAISAVDDQIGRMMSAMDDLGLREDTIVVVSSDHGDMLGSQGLRLKRKPWEESIRVPGIIRYPPVIAPGRRSELLSHIDLPPTLLALCGLKIPSTYQGTSFAPMLTGRPQRAPDSVFFQIFGPYRGDGTEFSWRGIRTQSHMYARSEGTPWVLYDIQRDPFELENLVDRTEAAGVRRELDGRLRDWMHRTGDSWKFNWTHPVEDDGRLYRHRAFHSVEEYVAWARANPKLDLAEEGK